MEDNRKLNTSGFTLVELAIVLVILGAAMASMISLLSVTGDIDRATQTNKHIDIIEEALADYYDTNGFLPCPAARTLAISDTNYGVSTDCTASEASVCTGTPKACEDVTVGSNEIRIGAIPNRTLNLPDKYSIDGWGNRLTYSAVHNMTEISDNTTNVMSFDGAGDYVHYNHAGLGKNDYTISVWARTDAAIGTQYGIAGWLSRSANDEIGILGSSSGEIRGILTDSGATATRITTPTAEEWMHLVVDYDDSAGTVSTYLNGAYATGFSKTIGSFNLLMDFTAGQMFVSGNTTPGDYFTGEISEVRLYSESLSDTEIYHLYLGAEPDDTNLELYWPLNESAGTTATDVTGSHDGAVAGNPIRTSEEVPWLPYPHNVQHSSTDGGVIQMFDGTGTSIPSDLIMTSSTTSCSSRVDCPLVAYNIISHGETASGAFTTAGTQIACTASRNDTENCDDDEVFIDQDIDKDGTGNDDFDDIIRWKTYSQIGGGN